MPIQKTLLERIRDPGDGTGRALHVSTTDVFNSILANLERILNTTRGNCLTDEAYGLPHLTEVQSTMPHSMAGFEAAIRQTIERFEPRLTQVRIRHSPSPDREMDLRFEITGIVQDEDGRNAARFETYADDNGRLRVR